MLVKDFHQHTGFSPTSIFHQHPSPTLLQSIYGLSGRSSQEGKKRAFGEELTQTWTYLKSDSTSSGLTASVGD